MRIVHSIATFTRPSDTTAYTSGDLVANSVTAGSVVPMTFVTAGKGFDLDRVNLLHSSATPTNASFRLHLYKDSPTIANGDNGAWSTTASGWIGSVDITATAPTFTDTGRGSGVNLINSNYAPLSFCPDKDGIIYGLLEARAAYTPASAEVFTVSVIGKAYD